jgi:hypothetical protein
VTGGILGVQFTSSVKIDTWSLVGARSDSRDVDAIRRSREKVPQRRCTAVAQEGGRPASKDSGHPAAVSG